MNRDHINYGSRKEPKQAAVLRGAGGAYELKKQGGGVWMKFFDFYKMLEELEKDYGVKAEIEWQSETGVKFHLREKDGS